MSVESMCQCDGTTHVASAQCPRDPVAEARALLAAATPGPWHFLSDDLGEPRDGEPWHVWRRERGDRYDRWRKVVDNELDQTSWGDAELIAATPRLLTALCGEVDRLRAEPSEAEVKAAAKARIDRDKLAEVLDGCFPGCDGPAAEDFIERYVAIAVDAVIAALLAADPTDAACDPDDQTPRKDNQ